MRFTEIPNSPEQQGRLLRSEEPIPADPFRRHAYVYLPRCYDESRRRYPVLYLQDGQNLFDGHSAWGRSWGVGRALDAAAPADRVIVVAVPHAGPGRIGEYAPFEDPRHGGGGADSYLDLLEAQLHPAIEKQFRALPDVHQRAIGGSSMGGLLAFYAATTRPHVYGYAIAMSPSLWYAGRCIFQLVRESAPTRLYLDIGSEEGEQAVRDVREMFTLLDQQRWGARFIEEPGARHDEAAWRRRFPDALYAWGDHRRWSLPR